ncbi:uncharacterized protein [Diadema setosum]|uniref:uncharacterized protein n=1 Tax=Diadema setosum TaxID=31175 RepID=UPI003B3B70F9
MRLLKYSVGVFVLLLLYLAASGAADSGQCTRAISRGISYTQTFKTSATQKYYTTCFLLLKCTRYRTVYSTSTRQSYRVGYVADSVCCPGWQEQDGMCITTMSPTTSTPPPTTQATTFASKTTQKMTTMVPSILATTRGIRTSDSLRTATAGPAATVESLTKASAGFLSNPVMMSVTVGVAVIVFLIIVVCGVCCCCCKRFRSGKKRVARLESQNSTEGQNGGFVEAGVGIEGAEGPRTRANRHAKMKGKKKDDNLTAASNPGYDRLALDEVPEPSTYEILRDTNTPITASENGMMAAGDTYQGAQAYPKGKSEPEEPVYEIDELVTENEYVTLDQEKQAFHKTPSTAPSKADVSSDTNVSRKKVPPKPAPKVRKEHKIDTVPPPTAANHLLVVPQSKKAGYLDMTNPKSKHGTAEKIPPPTPKHPGGEKPKPSPRVPRKPQQGKVAPRDKGSKTPEASRVLDARATTDSCNNVYDIVNNPDHSPIKGQISLSMDGVYVKPGTAKAYQPLLRGTSPGKNGDDVPCTYMAGDQATCPFSSDNYDLVGVPGSNGCGGNESDSNRRNHYDMVMTPTGSKKSQSTPKFGYDIPRHASVDSSNPYENERRSSSSLPFKTQPPSISAFADDEVYDVVEVRDEHSKNTKTMPGRPLVKHEESVSQIEKESQKSKTAIWRSHSGPSLLKSAELESVYVNTSRF